MKNKLFKKSLSLLLVFTFLITNLLGFGPMSDVEAAGTNATDIFISEYIEGGSYNKAIEIFNGTGDSIDLSEYSLEKDVNGAGVFGNTYALSGMLNNGDVYVVANSQAIEDILEVADAINNSVINFNGDDQVRLLKNGVEIDRIGISGDIDFGKDVTYVRSASVSSPLSGEQDPRNNENWEEYEKDTFTCLGGHTMDGFMPVASNHAPEITDVSSSLSLVSKGTEIDIAATITDDEGDTVTAGVYYEYSSTAIILAGDIDDNYIDMTNVGDDFSASFTPNEAGTIYWYVKATDGQAEADSDISAITVTSVPGGNAAPVIIPSVSNPESVECGGIISLAAEITDGNGDTVTANVYYEYSSNITVTDDIYNNYIAMTSIGDDFSASFTPGETGTIEWMILATDGEAEVNSGIYTIEVSEASAVMTIAQARSLVGETVKIEGTATVDSGKWGDKNFYIQDSTGGIYVYQNSVDIEKGEILEVEGDIALYNGETEIAGTVTIKKKGTGTVPTPAAVEISGLTADVEGQLFTLDDVMITDINEVNSYGTFEVNAYKNSESILVRVDNRTGLDYDGFTAAYENGDVMDITGILAEYDGTLQLKPRGSEDISIESGIMSIEEVKAQDNNTEVTVAATVTSSFADGMVKDFIQDSTGGINVYKSGGAGFSLGDRVKVTGTKTVYNGLNEIMLTGYEIFSTDGSVNPKTVTIDEINEDLEGMLIKLEDVTIGTASGSNTPVTDADSNSINIYNAPEIPHGYIGAAVDISAIVSEYNGTYQLHLRSASDIKAPAPVITNQSPSNISLGETDTKPEISAEYSSVVGIDISTIKLLVDDEDVTDAASVTGSGIIYTPSDDLALGSHSVKLQVGDIIGQTTSSTWNFSIGEVVFYHYRGQIHSHTEYSDGKGTGDDAFKQARDKGNADFFAITDHSNWFEDEKDPVNATIMDVSQSTSETWINMHEDADKYYVPGEFVAIAGYEMTWSGSTGGWGHINTFNTPWFMTRNTYDGNVDDFGKSIDLEEYYSYIAGDTDSINQLNHPGKTFGDFADFGYYSAAADMVVTLIEVGNGEGAVGSSGYWPSYEYYTRALDKGWHLAPTNNQDNHQGNFIVSNEARTVALATELTREGIYDAFRERRVYAAEDSNIEINYTVNGQMMGSILADQPETLDFNIEIDDPTNGDTIKTVKIISDGGVVAAEKEFDSNEISWEFTLDADYTYYYVRVDEDDKDIAVTAPVWTESVTPYGFNEVVASKDIVELNDSAELTATVYNNGSEMFDSAEVTFYKNTVDESNIIGMGTVSNIGAGSTADATISWTPEETGSYTILAAMTLLIDGNEKTFIASTSVEVMNSDMLVKIMIDHGHENQYISGDYEDRDTAFLEMLKEKELLVIEQDEPITAESLEGIKILVITSPQPYNKTGQYGVDRSKLTDDEIQAILDFIANGGNLILTSRADYSDHEDLDDHDESYESAAQANKLLEAIGSNLRINDDQVTDDVNSDGDVYRLLLNQYTGSKYNLVNDDVLTGDDRLEYRIFSGCSVILKDGGDDTNVDFLIKGHSTTYSNDADLAGDNTPVAQGDVYVLAAEVLPGGGKLVVAGSTLFSNFEIQDDNVMANTRVTSNILNWMKADLTPISDVRRDEDGNNVPDNLGKTYTIEGRITSMSESRSKSDGKSNAFFEVIYVQDETGGITVFGVSSKSLELGQKVRIIGRVDQYNNDTELQILNEQQDVFVYDGDIVPVSTVNLSTSDAMEESNEGFLVKVQGIVEDMDSQNLYINDGSGTARIYVEGYIGNETGDQDSLGKWDSKIKVGDFVSAIGLASEDSNGHRLRVRNTSEIKRQLKYDDSALKLIGRYSAASAGGEDPVAEIVKYDPETKKAFIVNGEDGSESIDIVDLSSVEKDGSTVKSLELTQRITINDIGDFAGYGTGDITCIDIHPSGEYFAVSIPASDKDEHGRVAFFDIDGTYIGYVTAGYLPDNLEFTPDGNVLLVANEGEPLDDYGADPSGSVSYIDVSDGADGITQDDVTDIGFKGVTYDNDVIIKDGSTPELDFEPEYIAIDSDSSCAYISLQENNAIAKLDIPNKSFVHVYTLGFKDYSTSGLDASDKDDEINIQKWPVLGMRMPDGIDIVTIGSKTYILTANEGDGREYGDYANEVRVKDLEGNLVLDADNYEGYTQEELDDIMDSLDDNENIGRLNVLPELGQNADGGYEALYSFGARSFSIFDAEDMSLVYDSGSDFEDVTAVMIPEYFNTTNDEIEMDNRSDNKGPEPEDVKVGKVGDKYFAYIGLERTGGVMVYDITDPENPEFVEYETTRDYSEDIAGDCGPEGLKFISRNESPIDAPILLVANEISGTLAVFRIEDDSAGTEDYIAKIAAMSDVHYFSPELGTTGAAFEAYLINDRKLIAESSYIAEAAVENIKNSDAEIVLVPGDLTKDGEKQSHEDFASLLAELEETGKKVYVINGNHDINNPHAVKYEGDNEVPVDYVTPEDFKSIYSEFGYDEAIAKDTNSLSYVVEPVDGLWIIAIDSAVYDTNTQDGRPATGGEFTEARLDWVKDRIAEGRSKGKIVIGMMHHGIVEHFEYQQEIFSEYVINNWQDISDEFADLGMETVFTGHFHAQDIVKKISENGNQIYDIETGSLVTYPCPYRLIGLTADNKMIINTEYVEDIDYDTGDKDFTEYAEDFLIDGINNLAERQLIAMMASSDNPAQDEINAIKQQINYPLSELDTSITIKSLVVDALVAHYQGDEEIDPVSQAVLQGLLLNPETQLIAAAVNSIWNDPAPNDNDVVISLSDPAGTDATLSSLTVSAGTLTPAFGADTTEYIVNVANSVSSINVTPTVTSSVYSSLTVNGTNALSGVAYGPVSLLVGDNNINIEVIAEDGQTSKTYAIKVNRAKRNGGSNDGGSPGGKDNGGNTGGTEQGTGSDNDLVGENEEKTTENIGNLADELGSKLGAGTGNSSELGDALGKITAAIDNINGDDNLGRVGDSLAGVIEDVSRAANIGLDDAKAKALTESAKAVIKSTQKLIDKVSTVEKATEIAGKIIESASKLLADADNARSEKKKAIDALKLMASKVVEKAGKESVEAQVEGTQATVTLNDEKVQSLIDKINKVIETAQNLDNKMADGNINANVEKKITVDVSSAAALDSVKAELPSGLLTAARDKGVDKVEIASAVATVAFAPDFVKEAQTAKSVSIEAKKAAISSELITSMSEGQKKLIDNGSTVFDFNALITDTNGSSKQVSKFDKPIEIKVKYELRPNQDPDNITVLYLADDGTVKNMTGRYDEETGTVKFITNHFSKYVVADINPQFSDVPNSHGASKFISSMAAKGIINGNQDSLFAPDDNVTRAEFATMITIALGIVDEEAAENFNDVEASDWYSVYIASAVKAGIMSGYADGSVRPDDRIIRQDMAVMIAMALNEDVPANIDKFLEFNDKDKIEDYARKSVAIAVRDEILSGKSGNMLDPQGYATKADAATIMYMLYNY